VSIVIISRGDAAVLESCMTRLGEPCRRFGAEMVIVVSGATSEIATLRKRHPEARVIAAAADMAHDDLRGVGLLEASGDIVAFTEDGDMRGAEWLAVLERRANNGVPYGPKPNGSTDWPRYLEERGLLLRDGGAV
jgi:hypothetical protein